MLGSTERGRSSPGLNETRDGCRDSMSPSNYMKASVQFPPYKPCQDSTSRVVTYDVWRNKLAKSPSDKEKNSETMFNREVKTNFEHVVPEKFGDTGTKTVTRTITPTGELRVYASQSSVRFKMTSNKKEERITPMTLPRPTFEKPKPMQGRRPGATSPDGRKAPGPQTLSHTEVENRNVVDKDAMRCRDLYPVTSINRFGSPARSISLKEPASLQPRFSVATSPSYSITHRESPKTENVGEVDTPQQGHLVVVAIDFGTTYSGYAYSFTNDPENISIMRKWEGK